MVSASVNKLDRISLFLFIVCYHWQTNDFLKGLVRIFCISNFISIIKSLFFQYKHAVYVQTCKLFADLERLRQERETKEMHERLILSPYFHMRTINYCQKSLCSIKYFFKQPRAYIFGVESGNFLF